MTLMPKGASIGLWCDTAAKVTHGQAAALVSFHYAGIARYVSLPNPAETESPGDIGGAELAMLCGAGLEVMLVQHVRFPGWDPSKHSGADDGTCAATHAKAAGYPAGAHVWLDLEGISGTAEATIAFAEAWAAAVIAAGYKAGLYVGYNLPLSADQLYALHGINSYWSDAGPRAVSVRGFAMKQVTPEFIVAGLHIDRDNLQTDRLGEVPCVAALAPPAA